MIACSGEYVSLLSNIFGKWLNFREEELAALTVGALPHGIGKTQVPGEILNKPGKLSAEEFAVMKLHATRGWRILQGRGIPDEVKLAALARHEKIDGSGYPLGVTGDKIHKPPKVIAICGIYEDMTARRVYRDPICPFEVMRALEEQKYGALEAEYLWVFLREYSP